MSEHENEDLESVVGNYLKVARELERRARFADLVSWVILAAYVTLLLLVPIPNFVALAFTAAFYFFISRATALRGAVNAMDNPDSIKEDDDAAQE